MLEKRSLFCLTGSLTLALSKMDRTVLEEKSYFKMLGLSFFSKLDWDSYIVSIGETVSKEIGALICSMKFPGILFRAGDRRLSPSLLP